MCTTTVYTYVHPDGHREKVSTPTLCTASRHNQVCAANTVFHYPYETPLGPGQMPPTPTYTPRSNTPNARSGDESDRSYHSATSSSRNKRPAGVYVNGQKILNLNKRSSRRSGERIVLVDSPPTPRTPPQTYAAPHTAPSSPNFAAAATTPYIIDAAPRTSRRASMSHHRSSQRPVIVDERPRAPPIQIEVRDARHGRHASSSSREYSSSSSIEDEERRRRHRRRQEKEEQRQREEEEIRQQRIRARIAKANAEIAGRLPVPMPPAPPRRSSTYARGTVEVPYDSNAKLAEAADAMRRMDIRDGEARRVAAEREEDEAQRQRLLERMQPRRRATVGPGSRRHRVLYDDGVYRWE